MQTASSKPTYFRSPDDFRAWLNAHAGLVTELLVGFFKRDSGRASITWPQAVDEALCVGWVDGVRQRIDDERYSIRFSPRKPGSIWSAVNIRRAQVLTRAGRMMGAGLAAFARRTEKKSKIYSYEQPKIAQLGPAEQSAFKKRKAAWAFFETLPPSYRSKVLWWVVSAKQPVTREKHLGKLIDACGKQQRL